MSSKTGRRGFLYRGISVAAGSDGRLHGKVPVGRKLNGAPDRRHVSGRDPAAIKRSIDKLLDSKATGTVPRPGRTPTVGEFLDLWLTDIAPYGRKPLRPKTLESYRSLCKEWIHPHLGRIRLDELQADNLDAMYAAMHRAGKASATVLKVHAVLRRALTVAQQRGRMTRNVARLIDNPGSTKPKRRQRALSHEQARKVLEVIDALPRNALRWKLGLGIGARQGEVLGLRWPVVDLDAGTVALDWQLQRQTYRHGCDNPVTCRAEHAGKRKHDAARCPKRRGGLVIVAAKTVEAGEDDEDEPASHLVALPTSLVAALREHRTRQSAERLRAGSMWQDYGLVFCQEDGGPIDPRRDWSEWQDILTAAGVRAAGTHTIRRTAATLMLEFGEDLAVIQEMLGHTDIRTTRGYTKVTVGLTRRAADAMDEGLFGAPPVTDFVTERQRRRSS
jgi:integrase